MSKSILALIAVAVVIMLVSGCGGGSSNGVDTSGSGRLTSSDLELVSGAHYDSLWLRPDRDCSVRIRMNATEVDPLIVLWDAYDSVLGVDDDSGAGRNAEMTVYLSGGVEYEVGFSTYAADSFGDYSYIIEEVSSSSAAAVEPGDKTEKLPVSLLIQKK